MSVDGFDLSHAQPFTGYAPAHADRFWSAVDAFSRRFHIETLGCELVPKGRALLVMNHAFGWDSMIAIAAIRRATGRQVWALGEHLWWKIPFLRRLAAWVGTVDGTAESVDALLAQDQLVLVLPGGLREAMKPHELRYRLLWGKRYGFVRAAIRNRAPLVPIAGIGADEVFELVGDAYARGRKWLHRDFPLPRPKWGVPIIHLPRLKYVIGEPVSSEVHPGEADEAALRRIRREVRGAIEELIDEELERRSAASSRA